VACARCGSQGRPSADRRCARCALAGKLTATLDDGTGRVNPALAPLLAALSGAGMSWWRLAGGGFAGADGIALGAELAGAGLAAGAGEGVDRRAILDIDQADTSDDRLPPCARQGTGNSPGPQVDVA
jgi:hypothetical protein